MTIPNNIIALSRQPCACGVDGANPEWDIKPVFDTAIADDVALMRFDTDSCRTVWSAMNDVRAAAIAKFTSDFGAGLRDYADLEGVADHIEFLKKDAISYQLAAECIQLSAVAKAYERIINSTEISRATMINCELAAQSASIFANRYKEKLRQFLENLPIPEGSAWKKREFAMRIRRR